MNYETEIENVELAIRRWQSRLQRAMTALKKLELRRRRLERRRLDNSFKLSDPAKEVLDDIPAFLQRDREAAEMVRAEQDVDRKRKAERSAEKREIVREVRDAELTGKRRKMPLSGRAALEALAGK